MDKVALVIKERTAQDIMSFKDEELASKLCLEVSFQELRLQPVLAFLSSCKFQNVVFNMKDNVLTPAIEFLMSRADNLVLTHEGEQGSNLLKVLCNMYPDKVGKLKHAALLKHDLMQVIEE